MASRRGARLLLSCLASAALVFGLCGLRAQRFVAQALAPALEGQDLVLTGMVAAMPQRSEAGLRLRLAVESATLAGQPVRLPSRVDLNWYRVGFNGQTTGRPAPAASGEPRAGERWRVTARLKAPHGARNPRGFDYELWLWEQGVRATGYVRDGPRADPPQRLETTWHYPVERARQTVRDAIEARVWDRRAAGVLAALVTGDQGAIERADWELFRVTGVAHLMSISGLHVTLFAWVAAAVVGAAWRRSAWLCLLCPAPQAALAGGVLLAGAYALFSGWGVPAQRTLWMLAAAALLRSGGRRWPWPQHWLLVMAVVLLADPWAITQAGFWLSFVAVGVLFATDSGVTGDRQTRAWGRLISFFREQWVITVALTPLSLLLFSQVSLVGLLTNALAIPWVTLLLTPLALLGVFWPPLWTLAAWVLQGLMALLQWFAAWPGATWSAAAPAPWAAVAAVAGALLLVMRLPWRWRALGLPLALPALLWQLPRPAPGQFELLAADIGQGSAVLVRTAGHTLLYDAGPRYTRENDAGQRVLTPLLRALGERVDLLLLSHRDNDHAGGAAAVLAAQPQAAVLSSIEAAHELQALRPATRCEAGQRWDWDGVTFELLHPEAADYERGRVKPNSLSCVLRVSNGTHSALLPGDIEAPQEAQLLRRLPPEVLRADLLLVPHHGSRTSSSAAWLDAVQPRIALVQSGYRNRFGHPAPAVLARYEARGITVLTSPRCGAARWRSSEPHAAACEREEAQRYWQHQPP